MNPELIVGLVGIVLALLALWAAWANHRRRRALAVFLNARMDAMADRGAEARNEASRLRARLEVAERNAAGAAKVGEDVEGLKARLPVLRYLADRDANKLVSEAFALVLAELQRRIGR